MKNTAATIILILLLVLCFVWYVYYSNHAEVHRIALIHSYEQEYAINEKARKLLEKELNAVGVHCEIREYYLNCEAYNEVKENHRMAGFLTDASIWGAELVAVLDDQATYSVMACKHPAANEIPVVFSGVNFPNEALLCQYPNVTGYSDPPDYLRTVRMIESIMGKSRVCLMKSPLFLDRTIWRTLVRQCGGQGSHINVSNETVVFTESFHEARREEVVNPLLKKKNIRSVMDTTRIVGIRSDSIEIRRLMWLGENEHSVFLYTRRDYPTRRIAMLYDNPTFEAINEDFGIEDYMLGGYFTPLENQMKYMAAGIRERLQGKIPTQQVMPCAKQYVINWYVMQRYQIPPESIPRDYTVMYIPFFERYYSYILAASILGTGVILTVILLLTFSLLRERRRKREALRGLMYEHETLSLAIEGNSTYVWRLEGETIFCDSQFYEFIHHSHISLRLEEVMGYIHPDDLSAFKKNYSLVGKRERHKGQYRCNFSGEYQWWEFSYNTIRSAGQAPIVTGLLQNIQEVKDHEEELIQARELAEQAELKQSFLNNMSHEIRTPLNAIAGFSSMLVNEPELSEEEKQEFADIINTNTALLLKLVEDVLELSRIESGNLSFNIQREKVCQLLTEVYQTHSVLIHAPLEFIKECPCGDVFVNVDPMRLTQVLTNFLNNATKFTKDGYIKLGYHCPPDSGEVHIYVEDTGVGIPRSEQKMIFERFYKRDEFSQGVGLGLSICQLIVEKMDGRIELCSEEGEGSRFTLVLPCAE